MATLYVVHGTIGGYAREDDARSTVYGVYTDPTAAKKVATVTHGQVETVELDYVAPGYVNSAAELGIPINKPAPAKTAAQHFDELYKKIATRKNYVEPSYRTVGGMWTTSSYKNGDWFAAMMDEGYSRYLGKKVNGKVVWRVEDRYPNPLVFFNITEEQFLEIELN